MTGASGNIATKLQGLKGVLSAESANAHFCMYECARMCNVDTSGTIGSRDLFLSFHIVSGLVSNFSGFTFRVEEGIAVFTRIPVYSVDFVLLSRDM